MVTEVDLRPLLPRGESITGTVTAHWDRPRGRRWGSHVGKFLFAHKGKKKKGRKNYSPLGKRRKFLITFTETYGRKTTDALRGWIRGARKVEAGLAK